MTFPLIKKYPHIKKKLVEGEMDLFRFRIKYIWNHNDFIETFYQLYVKDFIKELLMGPIAEYKYYYTNDWTLASSLVRDRKAILQNGKAYFKREHFPDIFMDYFKRIYDNNMECFINHNNHFQNIILNKTMETIYGFMNNNNNYHNGNNSGNNSKNLCDIEELDNFLPPCIFFLHQKLKNKKQHLRYDERFVYAQFLHTLGYPKEKILIFWEPIFVAEDTNHEKNWKKNIAEIESIYGKGIKGHSCHKIIQKKDHWAMLFCDMLRLRYFKQNYN